MSVKKIYERIGNAFKHFSPEVSLDSIIETSSDKTIKSIISSYNHVYVTWKGTVALTRAAVPLFIRRHGLYITYDDGGGLITDCFTGEDSETNNEEFIKDIHWKKINDYIPKSGTSENRPDDNTINIPSGFEYFDTTIGKPIWWNGANWVDVNGNEIQ